ncbi:3-deoxy-8-phosphooctulonate synthase [Desulfovibrio sulfodismutans]|uniref:3-deoxy-8-phosphooctulonate synthase n=2 Tax=Desulfolutivibrio sulfodismutans TaxID=63561 RepID=A0A7K3NRV3_9BACT|nr:3-deoxy-8-phosphooctulonate synthase [Desulfolutivibrio sulfodismutans]NDY58881.1 3-deoxy-8-phosphooctulonate synthase [Desulfolutivibrio sulfodismutans]QLA12830.1 3-deoxy-8-phosphooctulonate synthase [Desulfolutivibrio sulfodismutans DSM 3696]
MMNFSSFFCIAGPCVMESTDFVYESACALQEIFSQTATPWIFKSSFDKANRSSVAGFRGLSMDRGLEVLDAIRRRLGVPVVTDVHETWQVRPVAEVVDVLQTPALLCRQTDLIMAAAATGKPVNYKKGQFLAPWDMGNVIAKARHASRAAGHGEGNFLVCERGTMFGYNNLVVDMRGFSLMAQATGCPVVFDATHSVQLPGALGHASGGQPDLAPALARAAMATGHVRGVFFETHPEPAKALCDAHVMLPFAEVAPLVAQLRAIAECLRP